MACGVIAFALTFGVLVRVSLWLFAFVPGPLFGGFGSVGGSLVEDGFDGKEEFCEIDGGPFRKAANKRFNHGKFTFSDHAQAAALSG